MSDLLADLDPIGSLSPPEAAKRLAGLPGEEQAVEQLKAADQDREGTFTRKRRWWPFGNRAWQYTSHAYGYLPPRKQGQKLQDIISAGEVRADKGLQGQRVKLTLDRLRIADYPGGSTHEILFSFYGLNQVEADGKEHLHYTLRTIGKEGQFVGLMSIPIFVGLNVGSEGLSLRCVTVNVKNSDDSAMLSFLDSNEFKGGLRLAVAAQPVLAPFSAMAAGLIKAVANRSRNVVVQKFDLGLDFSDVTTRARLATGSYIVVQVPTGNDGTSEFDWSQWAYKPLSGHIVNRDDPSRLLPYNYVVLGLSRFQG